MTDPRLLAVVAAGAACAACAPARPAPRAVEAPARGVAPAEPPAGALVDAGELELRFDDVAVGRERFAIHRDGDGLRVHSETALSYAGRARMFDGVLEVDAAWRPRRGRFRSVENGGTVDTLAGGADRLALTTVAGGAAPRTVAAPAPVDLFLAENTFVHLTATCAVPPGRYVGFPGERVVVGGDAAMPLPGVVRREVDRGGAYKANVFCRGAELLAVDIPSASIVAIRVGHESDVGALRRRDRAKPAIPIGLAELPRAVPLADHATLACALVVPARYAGVRRRAGRGGLPAVVPISGTGPQDRDEDTTGPGGVKLSFFKVVAIALGRAGIASLRCDDRGVGESTGRFHEASLDVLTGDARAMVAALRREPAIDPARIGLVGHSEGGVIAPRLAARDRRLRAVALLAAPGRPLDVVLLEQMARAQRRAGVSAADAAAAVARHRAVFDAVAAGRPVPDTPEGRDWATTTTWLRSILDHDPAPVAARLRRVAVLVAQGARDQQVGVADAEALVDALARAGNRDVTVRLYPTLNHLFAPSATGDISEYSDPDVAVDARFIADLVAFLARL